MSEQERVSELVIVGVGELCGVSGSRHVCLAGGRVTVPTYSWCDSHDPFTFPAHRILYILNRLN